MERRRKCLQFYVCVTLGMMNETVNISFRNVQRLGKSKAGLMVLLVSHVTPGEGLIIDVEAFPVRENQLFSTVSFDIKL